MVKLARQPPDPNSSLGVVHILLSVLRLVRRPHQGSNQHHLGKYARSQNVYQVDNELALSPAPPVSIMVNPNRGRGGSTANRGAPTQPVQPTISEPAIRAASPARTPYVNGTQSRPSTNHSPSPKRFTNHHRGSRGGRGLRGRGQPPFASAMPS
jgi:hypothetical protein